MPNYFSANDCNYFSANDCGHHFPQFKQLQTHYECFVLRFHVFCIVQMCWLQKLHCNAEKHSAMENILHKGILHHWFLHDRALCTYDMFWTCVWDSKAWRYVFATAKRDDIHDNWDMSKMIVDQKCQMWNGVKQIVMNVRHRRENFLWAGNPCHKLGPYDQYFCSTTIIQLSLILQTMGITWFWHCVNFDATNSRFGTTMFTFTVGWQMCVTGRSRVQWYRLMLLQCHL